MARRWWAVGLLAILLIGAVVLVTHQRSSPPTSTSLAPSSTLPDTTSIPSTTLVSTTSTVPAVEMVLHEAPIAEIDGQVRIDVHEGVIVFEVVAESVETVDVVPHVKADDGTYYRMVDGGSEGGRVQSSDDGVTWREVLLPVEGPWVVLTVESRTGTVFAYVGGERSPEGSVPWKLLRRDGDQWVPLKGVAPTRFPAGPYRLRDRWVVLAPDESAFAGLLEFTGGCIRMKGAAPTETGLAVALWNACTNADSGHLALLGRGDTAIAVVIAVDGSIAWQSNPHPQLEEQYNELLEYSLWLGPDRPSELPWHVIEDGDRVLWSSDDGWSYERVPSPPGTPFAWGEFLAVDGRLYLPVADFPVIDATRNQLGEAGEAYLISSPDGLEWSTASAEIMVPEGSEPWIGLVSHLGSPALVSYGSGDSRWVLQPDGSWQEASETYWDWTRPFADHHLGRHWEFGEGERVGYVVDPGQAWVFGVEDVLAALDCGEEYGFQVFETELWLAGWNGEVVCTIKGTFEPSP